MGGNDGLLESWPAARVFAHESDRGRVPGQNQEVRDGQRFEAAGFSVRALHVPGHTLGAVAYVIEDAVFTGDTLFIGGCGRLFEGTPALMHASLSEKLGALPPATRVFCGHEYTLQNLRFAQAVEPDNARIADKLRWAEERARAGEPTVPSSIAEELATNPFLRCARPELGADPVAAFATLRRRKDTFA